MNKFSNSKVIYNSSKDLMIEELKVKKRLNDKKDINLITIARLTNQKNIELLIKSCKFLSNFKHNYRRWT